MLLCIEKLNLNTAAINELNPQIYVSGN